MIKKIFAAVAVSTALVSGAAYSDETRFPGNADEGSSLLPALTTFMDLHTSETPRAGRSIPSSGRGDDFKAQTTRADRYNGLTQGHDDIDSIIPKQNSRD
jgi:hypothetical protein